MHSRGAKVPPRPLLCSSKALMGSIQTLLPQPEMLCFGPLLPCCLPGRPEWGRWRWVPYLLRLRLLPSLLDWASSHDARQLKSRF